MSLVDERPATTTGRFNLREALSAIDDADLREATIDFFDQVRTLVLTKEIDVCVLAARRLSCLYLVLLNAGMPALPCAVYGDRDLAVQSEGSGWLNKRVLLLDDTVVVGSTLAFLHRDLVRLTGSRDLVDVRAICLDEEQAAMRLVRHMRLDVRRTITSQRMSQFSRALAKTLNRNLLPYFGDFQFTEPQRVRVQDLSRVLMHKAWIASNVTSLELTDGKTAAFSLLARDELSNEITDTVAALNVDLSRRIGVAKVRLFVRLGGFTAEVRAVPLSVLAPTRAEDVNRIFADIVKRLNLRTLAFLADDSWAAAKQRMLQVLCAHIAAKSFLRQMRAEFADAPSYAEPRYDAPATEINFGPVIAVALREMIEALDAAEEAGNLGQATADGATGSAVDLPLTPIDDLAPELRAVAREIQTTAKAFGWPSMPEVGEVLELGQSVAGFVGHLFSFIDGSLERPERQRIRDMTVTKFFDTYKTAQDRRLNQGLLLDDIAALICPDGHGTWPRMLASLVIDVCNDTGIAVPYTSETTSGQVERRYRIGENAFVAAFPYGGNTGKKTLRMNSLTNQEAWLLPRFHSVVTSGGNTAESGPLLPQDQVVLHRYLAGVRAAVNQH